MFFLRRRRHPINDEDLSAYVDGQLEAAARARLEAHIDACAACREALGELRALRRALRELPRAAAPRSFALREADVRPPEAPRPAGALVRAPALLGGVAMVAFVAFGVLVGVDALTEPSARDAGDAAQGRLLGYTELAEEQVTEMAPPTADERRNALSADGELVMEGEVPVEEEDEPGLPASGPVTEAPPSASPSPMPTAAPRAGAEADDDARTRLRAAEAATAAVALVAGGSLALVWWRRRA